MSRINGGYGLMMQISQSTIDKAIKSFYDSNRSLFRYSANSSSEMARYGISQVFATVVQITGLKLKLVADRQFELSFEIGASCRISTHLATLPGSGMAATAPELDIGLVARLKIAVDASYKRRGEKSYLALDLESLALLAFNFSIEESNVILGENGLKVMGALIRRKALYIVKNQVKEIPLSFTLKQSMPFLDPALKLHADYKIVSSGGDKGVAILLEVQGLDAKWDEVAYSIPKGNDLGLFIDRRLLSMAVEAAERFLPGISLEKQPDPSNPKRNGSFIINDVKLSLGRDCINVENVEIQIRILDEIQRTVRKVVCYLLGGACGIEVCDTILEYVMEEVLQLDQIANVHGTLTPKVVEKQIRLEPDLDANIARWAMFVILSLGAAILPAGGVITPILMIIGDSLLDRKVNEMVGDTSIDAFVRQSFPNANLSVEAYATSLGWTDSTLGIIGNMEFIQKSHA